MNKEFEEMWERENEIKKELNETDNDELTPDYLKKDAKAKYLLLADFVLMYLFTRYGRKYKQLEIPTTEIKIDEMYFHLQKK